ncbi:MAG: hypothetical protein Q9162_007124 [Coniocarpon cinnabarinum]
MWCRRPSAGLQALLPLWLLSTSAFSERLIQSDSLNSCSKSANETGFTVSLFQVRFTPDNGDLDFNITGYSAINSKVTAEIDVSAYGLNIVHQNQNPCEVSSFEGLCPMQSGPIDIPGTYNIGPDSVSQIPGIAYTVPDLDASVQIKIFDNSGGPTQGNELACLQAELSNGKTVYQKAVGWVTAVIAGLALLVSAIVSGLGHSNTAAHVAANAMSLFSYFQFQAMFGMVTAPLPPSVAAWTQNFQWSLGVIHVGFVQTIATWYQRATGGTPSTLLSKLGNTSVNVQKRSLEALAKRGAGQMSRADYYLESRNLGTSMVKRSAEAASEYVRELVRRQTTAPTGPSSNAKTVTVRGIDRVGFKAQIENTNIFMTGYIFFIFFVILVVVGIAAFKWILEALARSGKIKGDKFQDFRNGWTTVLKGILFRLILIGFPQMVVLCFWEMTVKDSAGEIALAVITIISMIAMLAWVCVKIVLIARRSITLHKNPAYILYSDPVCLHKWGFLYVQFKATAYWFIIPTLIYVLVIGMVVAFGQPNHGTAQGICFLVVNCGYLVALSILRPYMDKKVNAFNISIAAVNFVSSILLLFFTEIFGLPGLVVGVMGVVFFIMNAAFALVLLVLVLVAIGYAVFSKNPDVRYQPMRDDRGSFIKSQQNLTTELDALGATARGENKTPFKPREIDSDSHSSGSWDGNHGGYKNVSAPYNKEGNTSYDSSPFAHDRTASIRSDASRQRNNASPWQRGAGYDR